MALFPLRCTPEGRKGEIQNGCSYHHRRLRRGPELRIKHRTESPSDLRSITARRHSESPAYQSGAFLYSTLVAAIALLITLFICFIYYFIYYFIYLCRCLLTRHRKTFPY